MEPTNQIDRYSLEGSYMFNGAEEGQSGEVKLQDSWLIYGEITDFSAGGKSPKEVLGMRFADDGSVALLKLSSNLRLSPIVWYLKPLSAPKKDVFSGDYEGVWGTAGGMPIAMLQVITKHAGKLNLEGLTGLNPTELEEGIFDREVLSEMEISARDQGQTGKMRFVYL